ncbi:MAG: hypothetical protein Q4C82_09180 [Eubacteriales bacterium]|nr:hypothetical protein [Eubacteriales bacterium]
MRGRRIKKKGRYVLEAAWLVPGICLLLVYLVYFTLYAHDSAVIAHGMLESGVKGICRDGASDASVERRIREDLREKLEQRLLWAEEPDIEVEVNPVRALIRVSGEGPFLTGIRIEAERTLYRIDPCQTIRVVRRLGE